MARRSFLLLALCLSTPALAQEAAAPICVDASPPVQVPDAAALAARVVAFEMPAGLSVQQFQRLQNSARAFAAGRDEVAIRHFSNAVYDAIGTSGPDADIESLAFIVLMQMAREAAEDLKAIMAEVKAINNKKAAQRELLADLREIAADGGEVGDCRREPCEAPSLEARIAEVQDELDAMNEQSELLTLRLQMSMDRHARLLQTLSNIMKKISDTADQIVSNLK